MICEKYQLNKPVVEQPEYNLFSREKLELSYKNLFQRKLLGTTVWSPLLGGILTGKYNSGMPPGNRFEKNPDFVSMYTKYFGEKTKEKTLAALVKFE